MTDERLAEIRDLLGDEHTASVRAEIASELLAEVDRLRGVRPPSERPCARCTSPLGPKFYSDVPGVGDLCKPCHETWVARGGR